MKITHKTIVHLSGLALIMGVATPAFAGDGIYVSGGVTATTQENNQTRNTGSAAPNAGPANGPSASVVDKDTGIGFVGAVGYKTHFSNGFFGAVEAFYSTESAETTIVNNVLVNTVELNSSYGVNAQLGHDVTDTLAVYGLFGATAYDFHSQLGYTFAPPMEEVDASEWAFTYGGGVEVKLSERVSTFGEFRISNDLSFETPVDKGGVTSRNELNYTVLRTGIRFSF